MVFCSRHGVAALGAERSWRRMTIVAAGRWPWSLTLLAESLAVGRQSWACGLLPDAASDTAVSCEISARQQHFGLRLGAVMSVVK